MSKYDVYLYGMTMVTTMHLLTKEFPKEDTYSEIKESYILPGGETGSCALVLASLGCRVKVDGNFQGKKTKPVLDKYLVEKFDIDMSRVYYDPDFDGVQDMVIIGGNTRNCFGTFGAYYSDKVKRWNSPVKEDIANAGVVGLDPFFMEQSETAAKYCRELGKKYVTIDCKPDTIIHKYSEVNIISNEFIQDNFPDTDVNELFKVYTDSTDGLVIFTFGSREIMYGRKNQPVQRFNPFKVQVQSTLGAGDSFKARAVYGLFKQLPDRKLVEFAAATAATDFLLH